MRNRLTHLGLDFVAHSVPDDQPLKHEQLVKAGGKDQVPFLVDHTSGIKLYESTAILAYLDKAYGKPLSRHWLGKLTQFVDGRVRAWADPVAWRLSSPLLRAQRFQIDARNAVENLGSSWQFLRSRFEAALNEARAKTQATRATADGQESSGDSFEQPASPLKMKSRKTPAHPEVMSATGTA